MKGDTMTNEAADDLRKYASEAGEEYWVTLLDEALATERRMTVERIREALGPIGPNYDPPWNFVARVLDDISEEGTP